MAKEYSFIQPVIVGEKTNSYKPIERDGFMTVDRTVVGNKPVGSVVLYDYITGTYRDVDYSTASVDYIKKISDYANSYSQIVQATNAKQQELFNMTADRTSNTQINSFADVIAVDGGLIDFKPIQSMTGFIRGLARGDVNEAINSWWDASIFKGMQNSGKAAAKLIDNMVIKPLQADEPAMSKTFRLINNTLVNLSETVDMFTLANTVKGFVGGAIDGGLDQAVENANAAVGEGIEGRKQFDVNTGNTFADIGLEILADPTNWISLGSSILFKTKGVTTVTDMLMKSAQDIGETIARKDAKKLANKIVRYWKNADETIVEATARVQSSGYLKTLGDTADTIRKQGDVIDLDVLKKVYMKGDAERKIPEAMAKEIEFLKSLRVNADALVNSRTYKILEGTKMLRRTSDEVQQAAAQVALSTSATAIGYLPLKAVRHAVGNRAALYEKLQAIFNGVNPKIFDAKYTVVDVVEKEAEVVKYFDGVMKALDAPPDKYIDIGIANATRREMETFAHKLNSTLTANKPTSVLIREANEFVAIATNSKHVTVASLLEELHSLSERILPDIRPLLNDIENKYNSLYRNAELDVVKQTRDIAVEIVEGFENAGLVDVSTKVSTQFRPMSPYLLGSSEPELIVGAIESMLNEMRNSATIVRPGTAGREAVIELITALDTVVLDFKQGKALDKSVTDLFYTSEQLNLLYKQLEAVEYGMYTESIPTNTAQARPVSLAPNIIQALEDAYVDKNQRSPYVSVPKRKADDFLQTLGAYHERNIDTIQEVSRNIDTIIDAVKDSPNIITSEKHSVGLGFFGEVLTEINEAFHENAIDMGAIQQAITKLEELYATLESAKTMYYATILPNKKLGPLKTTRTELYITETIETEQDVQVILPSVDKIVRLAGHITDVDQVVSLGELVVSLRDGTITLEEAREIASILQDLFNKKGSKLDIQSYMKDSLIVSFKKPGTVLDVQYAAPYIQGVIKKLYKLLDDLPVPNLVLDNSVLNTTTYFPKLPHRFTFELILGIESLQTLFTQIYNSDGVGFLIELAIRGELGKDLVMPATHLATLAHHNYITSKIVAAINTIPDKQLRTALMDTISGMQRFKNMSAINNVEAFTKDFLTQTKIYLDRTTDNQPPMLRELGKGIDTRYKLQNLKKLLASPAYSKIKAKLDEGNETLLNVMYNLSPANNSAIYEVSFMRENGSMLTIVNTSVSKIKPTERFAKQMYGLSAEQLSKNVNTNYYKRDRFRQEDIIVAYNDVEFATVLTNYLKELNGIAREQKKTVRYIGFNNANESNATDRILNNYLRTNNTSQNIGYAGALSESGRAFTEDVAQLYRAEHGAWVASNSLVAKLEKLFASVGEYLEATTNAAMSKGLFGYVPKTVVNVNSRTIEDIRTMAFMLDRYLNSTDGISDEAMEGLQMFKPNELAAMRATLHSTLGQLADTLNLITNTNNDLSSVLVDSGALAEQIGNANIMPFIDGLGLGLKTMNNPAITKEWFPIQSSFKPMLESTFITARTLQTIYNRIRNNLLVGDFYKETVKVQSRTKQLLLGRYRQSLSTFVVHVLEEIPYYEQNPMKTFAVAYWQYNKLISMAPYDEVERIKDIVFSGMHEGVQVMLEQAQTYVFREWALYTPGISPIHSKYMQEDDPNIELMASLEYVNTECIKLDGIITFLNKQVAMNEANGISTVSERAHLVALQTYFNLYNGVRETYNTLLRNYNEDVTKAENTFEKDLARVKYSTGIQTLIIDAKDYIKNNHAKARIEYIFGMNAEEYTMYLYKYATGIQVIDTKAKLLKDKDLLWDNFTVTLSKAAGLGVSVYQEDDLLYVWLDITKFSETQLADLHKRSIKYRPNIQHNYQDYPDYENFKNMMDTYTDGAYSISNHSAYTVYQYDDLVSTLPEVVKNSLISKDYLDTHGMLTGKLNSTLLGDYTFGAYKIIKNISADPYTNIASGFNAVYNKMTTIHTYEVMLTSPLSTLNYLVHSRGFTHEDILRSGYIPARLQNGRIYRTTIKTKRDFARALENGTILLDYASFKKASEIINDNTIGSKFYQALMKYWGVPDKVSKLLSIGQMIRNIPESLIKIWIQAGGDPMVFIDIPTSYMYLQKYERTAVMIAKETSNFINKEAIEKFFAKHAGDSAVLTKKEYQDFTAFFKSSDAAPTAQQIRERNDVAGRLHRGIKSDKITEHMVQQVMDLTLELNRNYDEIDKAIEEKFTKLSSDPVEQDAILKELKLIKYLVPETYHQLSTIDKVYEKFYNHPILMMGSWIERLIRFHAFRYFRDDGMRSISSSLEQISIGQNNRSTDSKAKRLAEAVFPFSSFALHNLIFWAETANRNNSIVGLMEDVYSGMYREDELDMEEIIRNYSLQYALSVNNIIVNDSTGLTFKYNDSAFSAMDMLSDPLGTLAGMLNAPIEAILQLIGIINFEIPFYAEGTPEYEDALSKAKREAIISLIPVFSVLHTRYSGAFDKYQDFASSWLTMLFPSMFSHTKLDSAGTTYESRPIGYDWYSQSDEYRATHRYVFGVSYIPAWMRKDPQTYVDTYGRLVAMGLTKEKAFEMMEAGWYISYKDLQMYNWKDQQAEYQERQAQYEARKANYTPYTKKTYVKRAKKVYAKKSYAKRPKRIKNYYFRNYNNSGKMFVVNPRRRNSSMYPAAYRNTKYFGRRNLYKDMYAKYGASRMAMRIYAGANASAIKLSRETQRLRQQQQYRRF